jgi:CheY-like chemotaxis protein
MEWFGFVENKDTSADLIISDRENSTKYNDGQRILIIHEDMACSTKTEDVHHSYAIGKICSPIGPFKLARSLLALLDQKISLSPVTQNYVNQMDAGTQTPLGSPQERTIMNGIILTDYGFTPPSLPPCPTHVITEDPKPSPLAAWNAQQHRPANQTFASIATMSIHSPPLPSSTTSLPSPTFPTSRLPIMKLTLPTPKIITPPPDPVAKPTSRFLHILAVDDNALNLQLLHRYLLKRQGDTIVTARNGIEAVEAVKSLGEKTGFDVIFMDISMPEMDGFEATRLIRSYENTRLVQHYETNEVFEEKWDGEGGKKKTSGAYIVALTGLASRRDRDLAQECGFDDFLTKPISFKRIGELLRGLSEKGV